MWTQCWTGWLISVKMAADKVQILNIFFALVFMNKVSQIFVPKGRVQAGEELQALSEKRVGDLVDGTMFASEDAKRVVWCPFKVGPYNLWNIVETGEHFWHLQKDKYCIFKTCQKNDPKVSRLVSLASVSGKIMEKALWSTYLSTWRRGCLGKVSLEVPEVNHAWTTSFPSVMKGLDLWMMGEH